MLNKWLDKLFVDVDLTHIINYHGVSLFVVALQNMPKKEFKEYDQCH